MSAAREAWLYTLQIIGPHDAAAPFVPPPLKLRDVLAFHWTPGTSPDVRLPMCGVPPFSHNNIRQRQAREATRRARRCPAHARLPTARPAVAQAREACPASPREARSTRTGPQPVDAAEPEPSTRGTRRQRNQLHSSGLDFVAYGRAREVSPIAGRRRCLGAMGCPWRLHELPAAPSSDTRRLECSVVHSRAAVRCVESQKLDAEALVLPSPNFSRLRVAVWCRAAFWGAAGVLRRRGGGRAAAQLAINSPK